VAYVDTDAMAVMHHGRYFRYLERARVEWLRSLGIVYSDLEKQDLCLPLVSAQIDYVKPLRFDQEFTVKLLLPELTKIKMTLLYEIWSEGVLSGKASTKHVLCRREGADELSVQRIPKEWRDIWLQLKEKK